MRADVDGEARKVPCPKCGAKAGENCKNRSAAFADIVHRERRGKRLAPTLTGIVIPSQSTEETGHH